MQNVLLIVLLILALALIAVVLLQRSESGGLGLGGGGGGGGLVSARGAATALSKLTWVLGIAFMATSLALTIISAQNSSGSSVFDLAPPPAEGTTDDAPLVPSVPSDDLLPPAENDNAPLIPRAD
ncbi:preprotein translocase subunit SecG [Pseudaestuariivita rosea]|uniref:preprotein translocase subunit SecG n=1 Tax=Pseudaestuariivita rosea TaxID=2763263 RepID=UPI001ABA0658|nr:preprotein translocase subunit SecG [Pseudaestuariivita rosea]